MTDLLRSLRRAHAQAFRRWLDELAREEAMEQAVETAGEWREWREHD